MNASNVIDHPAASWEKAQTAHERIKRKEGELLDLWVELGTQLNLLRRRFPADRDFGAACEDHELDLTHQHRKAAMWWAGLDDDQRDSLREYYPTAIHPSSLERKCRNDFPEWITSTRRALGSSETDPSTTPDIEKAHETVSTPAETVDENDPKDDVSEDAVEKDQQQQNPIRLDRRTILVRTLGLVVVGWLANCGKIFPLFPGSIWRDSFAVLIYRSKKTPKNSYQLDDGQTGDDDGDNPVPARVGKET